MTGRSCRRSSYTFGVAIPKGAKNVALAKEFMKYWSEPKVLNTYLKASLGRWVIPMPAIAKSDPFWLKEDPHRTALTDMTLFGPTIPVYEARNPGMARVGAENVMMNAVINVMKNGMTPQAAIDAGVQAGRDDRGEVPDRAELRDGHGEHIRPSSSAARLAGRRRGLLDYLRGHLKGTEYLWALAFVIPYLAVFVVFVAYPIVYGLWMGHNPALYKAIVGRSGLYEYA